MGCKARLWISCINVGFYDGKESDGGEMLSF